MIMSAKNSISKADIAHVGANGGLPTERRTQGVQQVHRHGIKVFDRVHVQ
jgi:hypothetical protein